MVVSTEQFAKLAKAVMLSQRVPESIAIEIKGNPEFVGAAELEKIADDVTAQVVDRLTQRRSI